VAWHKEVSRTPLLQPATKVLLLDLYIDGMCQAGTVSVPRAVMAERMGVSVRQIDRRITDAITVGFLELLTAGRKNTTAVYMSSTPNGAAARRPRRARSGREPWRQDDVSATRVRRAESGAQRDAFKHPEDSDSTTRGGRAEPVDNTACRISARHAYVAPVVRRATNQPAHANGVPNLTPTDTGMSAYLSANGTATLTDTGVAADALVVVVQGQNWLQREGHQETQARLSTADLRLLVARCGGAL